MTKVEKARWALEKAEWDALAARAEATAMNRLDVAAIRAGFRFLALMDADIQRMSSTRGVMGLIVDSYEQEKAS
ncbi:MAG: hypothetical protein ACRCZP_19795 [Phycicoccus sp.]